MVAIEITRLDERAALPAYQSEHAAGMDLSACLPDGPIVLGRGEIALVGCGFAVALPEGYEGQVRPRSGLAAKHGVTVVNAPGTIDSDYRGEVKAALINLGLEAFTVGHGMRIAQLVVAPVVRVAVVETTTLAATGRGEGGFGSTGI